MLPVLKVGHKHGLSRLTEQGWPVGPTMPVILYCLQTHDPPANSSVEEQGTHHSCRWSGKQPVLCIFHIAHKQ